MGKRSRRTNPIDSPSFIMKFPHLEGDFCDNWRPSVSFHRESNAKFAELETKLRRAQAEADFYFWKSEELNLRLQNLQNQNPKPYQNQNPKPYQYLQRETYQDQNPNPYENLQRETCHNQNAPQSPADFYDHEASSESELRSTGQSRADMWTCRFCRRKEASCSVQPCGHQCLCFGCAFLTLNPNSKQCPVCEARFVSVSLLG